MLHSANGSAGGDHLWEWIYEDQSTWHQLYGIWIRHPAAHEPAGLTHGACKDEVAIQRNQVQLTKSATLSVLLRIVVAFNCHSFCLTVCVCLVSLIHSIATRVIKLAHAKSSIALAPALVETYSRLLVYMEIESLGIKGFISEL